MYATITPAPYINNRYKLFFPPSPLTHATWSPFTSLVYLYASSFMPSHTPPPWRSYPTVNSHIVPIVCCRPLHRHLSTAPKVPFVPMTKTFPCSTSPDFSIGFNIFIWNISITLGLMRYNWRSHFDQHLYSSFWTWTCSHIVLSCSLLSTLWTNLIIYWPCLANWEFLSTTINYSYIQSLH